MSRLPSPGADVGTWGNVLNDYLSQSHNADGTLKLSSLVAAGGATDSAVVHKSGDTMSGTLVVPSLQVTGGTPTSGYVLASDGSGNASWTISPSAPVSSVAGRVGVISLAKSDVGLSNVDNTADASKPVSTAQQSALDLKETTSNKGLAGGYASLNGSTVVPTAQLGSGSATGSNFLRGDNTWATPAAQNLTGDVTSSGIATTLTTNVVSNAKLAQAGANTLKGNNTGGTANVTDLTASQAKTLLAISNTDVSGLGTASTLASSAVVQTANNLSDLANKGTSLYNLSGPAIANVQAVATTNLTLSGTQTVDGYAASVGDRILAAAQTATSQNGPWLVASGAWTRPTDYPSGGTVKGRTVQVTGGSVSIPTNAGTLWHLLTTGTVTIDTTGTTWVKDRSSISAGAGTYAARPSATTLNDGITYYATDLNGGTLLYSLSGAWNAGGPGVNQVGGTEIVGAHPGNPGAWLYPMIFQTPGSPLPHLAISQLTPSPFTMPSRPVTVTLDIPGGLVNKAQSGAYGIDFTINAGSNWYTLVQKPFTAAGTPVNLSTVVGYLPTGSTTSGRVVAAGNTVQVRAWVSLTSARAVTDGVTNGTTTVTSATANFLAADVTRSISGGTIPTGTTIASVTNTTTVVLSAAATGSASGVSLNIGDWFELAAGDDFLTSTNANYWPFMSVVQV